MQNYKLKLTVYSDAPMPAETQFTQPSQMMPLTLADPISVEISL